MEKATFNYASIEALAETIIFSFSSLSSHPLFSTIIALYTLIFIYLPTHFFSIIFSPILVSTGIILLTLLRFGATSDRGRQNDDKEGEISSSKDFNSNEPLRSKEREEQLSDQAFDEVCSGCYFDLDLLFADSFVQWNVKAPLEVIYEEYEGEAEENNDDDIVFLERHASLSLYYPETDSDSTSSDGEFPVIGDWDSPRRMRFRWEYYDDGDKEGLIEIALDGKRPEDYYFHLEEDNLIEIDISPVRTTLTA